MDQGVIYFIINVIIKDQQYVYLKMRMIIYLEDMLQFHGHPSSGSYYTANGSFLFTLTNIHGTEPTKFPNNKNYNYAVYHNSGYGPTFGYGHDIYISNNYLNNNCSEANLGYSYNDVLGKGNSTFSSNNNSSSFKLKELEVFKLFN